MTKAEKPGIGLQGEKVENGCGWVAVVDKLISKGRESGSQVMQIFMPAVGLR
jgi:hypothetical protein